MFLWLLCGLWALSALAHLMDRWDSRGRHEFLGATLCVLAVMEAWRPTASELVAASTEIIAHLPNGDLTLTPRLASPVILMSILTTLVTPPLLRLSLNAIPPHETAAIAPPLAAPPDQR